VFYDAVAPHVARVVAVDPNQFQVISHSVKKKNLNDARNLALYLSKGLLPEVRMKEKTQAQIASLTQTRDTLVKLRTALKNKVNSILLAHGINREKEALSLIAQRYSPYPKKFYEKTKARRGSGKAIIALARKLLGIVYLTLKSNWVFQDFPNFVLSERYVEMNRPAPEGKIFGTVRSSQGRAGFAQRSAPLTARTVREHQGEGKGGKRKDSFCGLLPPPVGRRLLQGCPQHSLRHLFGREFQQPC
jgi:hypothetical protein